MSGNLIAFDEITENRLTIIVVGASGDLAKKKTFPALFNLSLENYLPNVTIVGYARTKMSDEEFRENIRKYFPGEKNTQESFLKQCFYIQGSYDQEKDLLN